MLRRLLRMRRDVLLKARNDIRSVRFGVDKGEAGVNRARSLCSKRKK